MGYSNSPLIISAFVFFLFFFMFSVSPVQSLNFLNQNFNESEKLNLIRAHLKKINKPAVKTIQSPDGDIIDCVLSHKQPAFDHPLLKGQKPLDPPELPKGYNESTSTNNNFEEVFQAWTMFNESCPDETIPIRRTTEQDLLRFGTKTERPVRRDPASPGDDLSDHQYATGYVEEGGEYYGAKASINVWTPRVAANRDEFSLAQLWVTAGSNGQDNTVEAGWQVYPDNYGDNKPRLFTYWTRDGYKNTGCYNLYCSGFVQTSKTIALGAAIAPTSSYGGSQFEISLLVWKDIKDGNWWLAFGNGIIIGYWPSFLFTLLRASADSVEYGGEIVNTPNLGSHTSTQMGSGHFAGEGYGKAAYFRNLQLVDWDNSLIPVQKLQFREYKPNCYDVQGNFNKVWGTYFYYGGPGRNPRCP